jgi:predicted nucleotidyltransferase
MSRIVPPSAKTLPQVKSALQTHRDIFNQKKFKLATPMEDGAKYPLKTMADAGPLLKARLREIVEALTDELGHDDFKLYLRGSQIRGRSRSGSPDIDLTLYCSDLVDNDERLVEVRTKILLDMPYKIDLGVSRMSLENTRGLVVVH